MLPMIPKFPHNVVTYIFTLFLAFSLLPGPLYAHLRGYIIGPQDVLKIEVWDNPDLSREVTVSLTNTISFPLIGKINVEGFTPKKLQQIVESALADGYLVNPQVAVTVEEFNSKKVYVLGEVKKPGYYPFSKVTTMVEIISMAGGLTPDAGQEAYILRSHEIEAVKAATERRRIGENEKTAHRRMPNDDLSAPLKKNSVFDNNLTHQVITINLNDFNKGVNLDYQLQNNDTLYIPEAKFFYVIGEVKSPGRFKLEKEINILQAISMAGGVTQKASERKTKIIRTSEGRDREIRATMMDSILAGDIIKVPERFF